MKYKIIIYIIIISTTICACKKRDDFLDKKSNEKLTVLSTLEDVQQLLQNEIIFNLYSDPGVGCASSDDYFLSDDLWLNASMIDRNIYTWAKQIYPSNENMADWSIPYQQIYYANTALEAIAKLQGNSDQATLANLLTGRALFYRSYAYFNLLELFSLPYDSTLKDTQLGVPIRLSSDINIQSRRASQNECFNQIIKDLQVAIDFLPESSLITTQPSKASTYAILSRIFLTVGNYPEALLYANKCLNIKKQLTNYNRLTEQLFSIGTPATDYPLVEVIYNSTLSTGIFLGLRYARPDSELYASYDDNDLRKQLFFTSYFGYPTFVGSYEFGRSGRMFSGIATDEVYLIRAECLVRQGNVEAALDDLNFLLENRYKTGTFQPLSGLNNEQTLTAILKERRKELCFRGTRWIDLRRLNKDHRFATILKRKINGTIYSLPPNDPRYALPIPENEIQMSGIQQNER